MGIAYALLAMLCFATNIVITRYAVARLPHAEPVPVPALAYAGVDATLDERKSWGIIEID